MQETSLRDGIGALAAAAGMRMEVPALKGRMGNVDYFVITLPFSVAERYITTTDSNLPPQQRENRKPTPSRYREIAQYIRNNPDDYRFSAITCTYGRAGTSAPVRWEPAQPEGLASTIGTLTLDQTDPLVIVDGQHRLGAIRDVINEDPSLRNEVITVVLFPYLSVNSAQQLFSDLNRTAKKTTKSLDILFDNRDAVNRVVQQLVQKVRPFVDRVNLEDASVPTNSNQMFTLAAIYQATKPMIEGGKRAQLLPPTIDRSNEDEFVEFLVEAWEFIAEQFPEWGLVASGQLDIRSHRTEFIHWNSGVLSAVGEFAGESMRQFPNDWRTIVKAALSHPFNNGWRRDPDRWQGIASSGTQVLPRSLAIAQLRVYLKARAGFPLSEGEMRQLQSFPEATRKSLLEDMSTD